MASWASPLTPETWANLPQLRTQLIFHCGVNHAVTLAKESPFVSGSWGFTGLPKPVACFVTYRSHQGKCLCPITAQFHQGALSPMPLEHVGISDLTENWAEFSCFPFASYMSQCPAETGRTSSGGQGSELALCTTLVSHHYSCPWEEVQLWSPGDLCKGNSWVFGLWWPHPKFITGSQACTGIFIEIWNKSEALSIYSNKNNKPNICSS